MMHCFKMNAYVSYTIGKTIDLFHLNKEACEGGTTKEGYYMQNNNDFKTFITHSRVSFYSHDNKGLIDVIWRIKQKAQASVGDTKERQGN